MSQENKRLVIQVETPFLTVAKLAEKSGLSISTIRRLIHEGHIQAERVEGTKSSLRINMVDMVARATAQSMTLNEFLTSSKQTKGTTKNR